MEEKITLEQFTQVVRAINHIDLEADYWGIVTYDRVFDAGFEFNGLIHDVLPAGSYLWVYAEYNDKYIFLDVLAFACYVSGYEQLRDRDIYLWKIG